MKKLLLTLMLATVAMLSLQAKIWRINNNPSGIPADFTNGQAAHNAASAGDTLYFESSPTQYPSFTIRKQLTVIGLGAYLNSYSGYQIPGLVNASINVITLKPGASGTHITGLQCRISADTVNNIQIYRNLLTGLALNYVSGTTIYHNSSSSMSVNNSSNIVINNNQSDTNGGIQVSSTSSQVSVFQNTIGSISATNSAISNNIIMSTSTIFLYNCTFSNNVLVTGGYYHNSVLITSGGNNLFSQSPSNIFTLVGTATDKLFELKAGSPAIGAASDGGDCGATGGANPYVFNGLQPAIPSIYKLTVPGVVTGATMPVSISTRAN